jgi:hypothetical protein
MCSGKPAGHPESVAYQNQYFEQLEGRRYNDSHLKLPDSLRK